jgi:hypothetical protein
MSRIAYTGANNQGHEMKKFIIAATCAALLGSVSVASANPMDSNARMMHRHHHMMMMKKPMMKHHGMMRHGMMRHGMMKHDGMKKM